MPPLDRLWTALPTARLVGGAVRDRLANIPVSDHDLATPDPPDIVVQTLKAQGIRTVPTGLAHGTVTAILDGHPFEITTLRRDVRTDGRHAETEWTDDWQEDAARRDFTINAMSLDRAGTLHDYFNGREDLAAGRVRFVGDPARRIEEDHLRILRFLRFHARFARTAPDPEAIEAIASRAPLIARLSAERVWSELKRLLALPTPSPTLHLAANLGVLPVTIPEGADPARVATLERIAAPADPILRLAALLTGDPQTLATRLRLSGEDAQRLTALQTAPAPNPADDDPTLRRLLADHPPAILTARTWLTQPPDSDQPAWTELRARLDATPPPIFPLAGRDALALGTKPGKQVGEALRRTRDWWLAHGATADRAACLAELVRQLSAPDPTC
jgi:poly(A) polymerase